MPGCEVRRCRTYLLLLVWLSAVAPGYAQPTSPPPLTWYVPQRAPNPPFEPHRTLVGYQTWAELADKLARQPHEPYHLTLIISRNVPIDWRVLRSIRPATALTLQLADSTAADSLMSILAQWPTLKRLNLSGVVGGPESFTVRADPKTGERLFGQVRQQRTPPQTGWAALRSVREVTLDQHISLASTLTYIAALPNLETLRIESLGFVESTLPPALSNLRHLRHLSIAGKFLKGYAAAFQGLTSLLTLRIDSPDLDEFNAGLAHLTGLQMLEINSFRDVEKLSKTRFGQLPALRALRLWVGPAKQANPVALDSALAGLHTLRSLTIEGLPLTTFPLSLLTNRQLDTLTLRGTGLTTLPAAVDQLTNLSDLTLDNNPLRLLPLVLCRLPRLRALSLNQCELDSLPPELGQLTSLAELSLSTNQLTYLPAALGQLTQLQRLNLTMNQLTALPAEVGRLPRLETLAAFWNQLTDLPGGFPALKHLYVSDNHLTRLTLAPATCRRLRSLSLNGNPIRQLPENLGQLDSLETLILGDNELTRLPASLGQLRHLSSLTLGPNGVRQLPETVGGLTSLTHVSVIANPLETLPTAVGTWRQLRRARFELPHLRYVPEQIGAWQVLDELTIQSDQLLVLPNELTNCRALTDLTVGGKRLMGLPESIGQLTRLQTLTVQGQADSLTGQPLGQCVALPASLASCTALAQLTVQHQALFDGTEALQLAARLPYLDRLTLQNCGLTELGYVDWGSLRVTYLNLSQNRLSQLPNALLQVPRLRDADFSYNNLPAHLNRSFRGMVQLVEAIRQ